MPGRDTTFKSTYRYGFNGKEMDNEPYGQGNEYNYGFRIYNPRIGRFLSSDPLQKKYASLTPYQFSSNSPMANVDQDGREAKYYKVITEEMYDHWGNLVKTNQYAVYDKSRESGWHVHSGIIPYYTSEGNLGNGILVTYETHKISEEGIVPSTEISNTGYAYIPGPPKPDNRPVSSFSYNFILFGNGGDPSESPADKPNPNATYIKLNFKELMSMIDVSTLGMNPYDLKLDTKTLPGLVDKLRKLKQYEKDYPETNNLPTDNSTQTKNYPKPGIKPGEVVNFGPTNQRKKNDSTWETTSDPAQDTSPVWKGYQKKY